MKKIDKQPHNVRQMFSRISKKYDLLNRLMSLGFDLAWRRYLIKKAGIPHNGRVLDAGAGTGDIALEILKSYPSTMVTGIDLTIEMMEVGRERAGARKIAWCLADALVLPFPDNTFDAVFSGFLARNVCDLSMLFREQIRVGRPGGRVLCLDTSPIPENILKPFTFFYLNKVIPFMGNVIANKKEAYTYLPESTINFIQPQKLADIMRSEGLENVGYKSLMFGNISVHWGTIT